MAYPLATGNDYTPFVSLVNQDSMTMEFSLTFRVDEGVLLALRKLSFDFVNNFLQILLGRL